MVHKAQLKRLKELSDFIKLQPRHITTFDETLVRRVLKKITIYDATIEIELKAALKIEVK